MHCIGSKCILNARGPPKKLNSKTDMSSESRRFAFASLPYHGNGNWTFSNEKNFLCYCLVWPGLAWSGGDSVSVECILRMSLTFITNIIYYFYFFASFINCFPLRGDERKKKVDFFLLESTSLFSVSQVAGLVSRCKMPSFIRIAYFQLCFSLFLCFSPSSLD